MMFLNKFIIIVNYKKIERKFLTIIKHPLQPTVVTPATLDHPILKGSGVVVVVVENEWLMVVEGCRPDTDTD